MKNIFITAAALTLFATTSLVANPQITPSYCVEASQGIISDAVTMRDEGVDPQEVFDMFLESGYDEEVAFAYTLNIYQSMAHWPKEEIVKNFYEWCLGKAAKTGTEM